MEYTSHGIGSAFPAHRNENGNVYFVVGRSGNNVTVPESSSLAVFIHV